MIPGCELQGRKGCKVHLLGAVPLLAKAPDVLIYKSFPGKGSRAGPGRKEESGIVQGKEIDETFQVSQILCPREGKGFLPQSDQKAPSFKEKDLVSCPGPSVRPVFVMQPVGPYILYHGSPPYAPRNVSVGAGSLLWILQEIPIPFKALTDSYSFVLIHSLSFLYHSAEL
jgi:hypothetical protein